MPVEATYVIEQGDFGPVFVPLTAWNEGFRGIMLERGTKELLLNSARGFVGHDLTFLERLHFLEGFEIIDHGIRDISVIHCLKGLRSLAINTYCRTSIDFACFPSLEICFLEWRRGCESVFDCVSLKRLYLDGYKGHDSFVFRNLRNLECLILGNGPMPDVKGLALLRNLEELSLLNLRKLESLQGIENLPKLWKLCVQGCRRISRIDEVANIKTLEVLDLSGNGSIESIRPLAGLPNLADLYLTESTYIVDGDLDVVLTLPRLGRLFFQNRKHYNHRHDDFWQHSQPLPHTRPPRKL